MESALVYLVPMRPGPALMLLCMCQLYFSSPLFSFLLSFSLPLLFSCPILLNPPVCSVSYLIRDDSQTPTQAIPSHRHQTHPRRSPNPNPSVPFTKPNQSAPLITIPIHETPGFPISNLFPHTYAFEGRRYHNRNYEASWLRWV